MLADCRYVIPCGRILGDPEKIGSTQGHWTRHGSNGSIGYL